MVPVEEGGVAATSGPFRSYKDDMILILDLATNRPHCCFVVCPSFSRQIILWYLLTAQYGLHNGSHV
jgi:hypothetical protein